MHVYVLSRSSVLNVLLNILRPEEGRPPNSEFCESPAEKLAVEPEEPDSELISGSTSVIGVVGHVLVSIGWTSDI